MRYRFVALFALSLSAAAISVADGQTSTKTYVSSLGSDANPCSRAAPCATFASALTKTAAGGEIRALDAGLYGIAGLTITKSITIDGGDGLAAMTVVGTAIAISAERTDIVVLKNLTISRPIVELGAAIDFRSGNQLVVDKVNITCENCMGIVISGRDARHLIVSNSTIIGSGQNGIGVRAYYNAAFVTHTVMTALEFGLLANLEGVITADSNVLTGNQVAVQAGTNGPSDGSATVRLSNNQVYNNRTGFGCGGGVLASTGTNRKGGNVGGVIATCSPTVIITQQ